MASGRGYHDLRVWQRSIELTAAIYRHTASFQKSELYGLTNQMRRAAVSVPSNIAEGQAHRTPGNFKRFLDMAMGSLAELDTQAIIAKNLCYLDEQTCAAIQSEITEIRKMLYALSENAKY